MSFSKFSAPGCWTPPSTKQAWWGPSLEIDAQGGQEQREAE